MPRNADSRRADARWAIAQRWGNVTPDLIEERRAERERRIAEYLRETVDATPPLTHEQRSRLAAMLTQHGTGGAAA
jgi:hypothetical protein